MPTLRGYQPYGRKVECAVCGQKWRQQDMRKGGFGKQKGLEVCPKDFDSVHPNEAPIPHKREGYLDDIK